MGIVDRTKELLKSAVGAIGAAGAEAVTKPVKDITGAAKDVVDIRKDLVETRLAEKRLENEERLIHKATLEDVKRYDSKTRNLLILIDCGAFWSAGDMFRNGLLPTLEASCSCLNIMVDGKITARLRPVISGRLAAKNRDGRILAVFDFKRNRTYSPQGRLAGKGNLLRDVIAKNAGVRQLRDRQRTRWREVFAFEPAFWQFANDRQFPSPPVEQPEQSSAPPISSSSISS